MIEIPKEEKQRIFEAWFVKGDTRDGIAADVRVGEGSVTNVVKEYEENIGKPSADLLRKQAVARRKAGLTSKDDLTGAVLAHRANEKGISQKTAGELIEGIVDLLATPKLAATPPEELAQAAVEVIKIAKDHGIQVSQVRTWTEEESKKSKAIGEETDAIIKVWNNAKLQSQQALADASVTEKQLADFIRYKKKLGENCLITLDQTCEFIETIKGLENDPIRAKSEISSLRELKSQQKRTIEGNAILARNQAQMRAKDALYDRVCRSGVTVPLWDAWQHKINMIAISQGRDKDVVMREAFLDFAQDYDALQGLLPATIRESTNLKRMQMKAGWARYQFEYYKNQIPSLEKVYGDLKQLVDQEADRLDNVKEEEKKHRNNLSQLEMEEGKRREAIRELDMEVNKRRDALVKLSEEPSKKKDEVLVDTGAPERKVVDVTVMHSGLLQSNSGHTTLNSGCVTSSGFVPQFNSGSTTLNSGCVTSSGFSPTTSPPS